MAQWIRQLELRAATIALAAIADIHRIGRWKLVTWSPYGEAAVMQRVGYGFDQHLIKSAKIDRAFVAAIGAPMDGYN